MTAGSATRRFPFVKLTLSRQFGPNTPSKAISIFLAIINVMRTFTSLLPIPFTTTVGFRPMPAKLRHLLVAGENGEKSLKVCHIATYATLN